MIGTEFLKGQGLGNQLFCYITARSIAEDLGYQFGTAGQEQFANNIHSQNGMYFLDVDLGEKIEDTSLYTKYYEAERRLYIPTGRHDIEHGCYVSGADKEMMNVSDQTLLYGNMQSEAYFSNHIDDLKKWLKVKPEFDSYEYSQDDLCILNMRGGEYVGVDYLYLTKKYWLLAMKQMKKINPNMRFMIVTEDVKAANKLLPGIPAYHFDMGKDYVTVKNAKYLIVSNSSFACLPAMTSDTLQFLIAPKYWARHNVSDGYWASEQNIYSGWNYMDRKGRLFSAEQCKEELEKYKNVSKTYRENSSITAREKEKVLRLIKIKDKFIRKYCRLKNMFR